MMDIHTQELIDRICGLSEEEKMIVVGSLPTELLLAEVVKRALNNEAKLKKMRKYLTEQGGDQNA